MAGDWIKMRPCLISSPKVNGIAKILETDTRVCASLSTGYSGVMAEIVTRNVTRYVTVASLLVIWGAANEHTQDGIFKNADLTDLDDLVGIVGFGEAMEAVGWAIFNPEEMTVTLSNFSEYNVSIGERSARAKTNAQRQKEYRERNKAVTKALPDSNRDSNVTSNRREEKRRSKPPSPLEGDERFSRFWACYPKKAGKGAAEKAWASAKINGEFTTIIESLERQKQSQDWIKEGGKYIPHPVKWIKEKRWLDGEQPGQVASIFKGVI